MARTMLIAAPAATRSGYGDMSRDICAQFIEWAEEHDYNVLINSLPWGDTPMNALEEDNPRHQKIQSKIMTQALHRQPEIFVHIGIPNEAKPYGKFNILCTAGIETTRVSAEWIHACNQMDLILTISEHSKRIFETSKYGVKNPQGGQDQIIELQTPIDILHNCVHTDIFGKKAPQDQDMIKSLNEIPENFCFLFVGHWLRGEYGEDRKNVGLMIRLFLETFRQVKIKGGPPALVLKTSSAGFSILDREEISEKIRKIKSSVKLGPGETLPSVYLLHGELTPVEMNTIYNHKKVKAHLSFTKGEGFGRPLLEASMSEKPIIASGWSGHLDFLDKDRAMLVGGDLTEVHDSVVWEPIIVKGSSWFSVDHGQAMNGMAAVASNYREFKNKAYDLAVANKKQFSYEAIRDRAHILLDQYIPDFPDTVDIKLPSLQNVGSGAQGAGPTLPKLSKVSDEPAQPRGPKLPSLPKLEMVNDE